MQTIIFLTAVISAEPAWVEEIQFRAPTVPPTIEVGQEVSLESKKMQRLSPQEAEPSGRHQWNELPQRLAMPATPFFEEHQGHIDGQEFSSVLQAVATVPAESGAPSGYHPREFVEAMFSLRSDEDGITGVEFSLSECLDLAATTQDQLTIVKAYWILATRLARYHATLQGENELAAVALHTDEDQTVMQAAVDQAHVRSRKHYRKALRSQFHMVDRAGMALDVSVDDNLPLAADLPLVSAYPLEISTEDGSLPHGISLNRPEFVRDLQLDVEENAFLLAEAVSQFGTSQEDYQLGQAGVDALLEVHRELAAQRERFLAAVLRYNWEIAKQVVSTYGQRNSPEQLDELLLPGETDAPSAMGHELSAEARTVAAEEPVEIEKVPVNGLRKVVDEASVKLVPIPDSDE